MRKRSDRAIEAVKKVLLSITKRDNGEKNYHPF